MTELKTQSNLIPTTPRRILIVDDEKGIRDVFMAVVASDLPDCRVDLAINGAEAVESFRSIHHQVIVMDLNMPVMNGLDAFTEMQAICRIEKWAMPAVIFCTGFDPPHALNSVLQSGSTCQLLRKPVTNKALVQAVSEQLKG